VKVGDLVTDSFKEEYGILVSNVRMATVSDLHQIGQAHFYGNQKVVEVLCPNGSVIVMDVNDLEVVSESRTSR
tara:strand:+ start:9132 stop:9350 length:219 start_codon:yes stop_codon:yes gene_type:complete